MPPPDDPSSGATVHSSESSHPAPPEREVKFLVPPTAVAFARSWIASACMPDPQYPPAWVVTVYFDTQALDRLAEKANSDYLKTKVRVRWYAPLDGGEPHGTAFVECKRRVGSRRSKVRVASGLPAADVARWPLADPRWIDALDVLRQRVRGLDDDLAPILRLRYRRDRYVNLGGERFSIDSEIVVEGVNPARVPRPMAAGVLPTAILEYKGRRRDLPDPLTPVMRLGATRASFSKYVACYEHVVGGLS